MNTSEKLIKTAQYAQETVELNNQLEQILYGTDTGGKSFYDEFWDGFQLEGKRNNFTNNYAFAFAYMNSSVFYPKYDIKVKNNATNTFYNFNNHGGEPPIDLVERLEKCGVSLDFSEVVVATLAFGFTKITRLGIIDLSSATNLDRTFYGMLHIKKIEKVIVNESHKFVTNAGYHTFYNLPKLEEITFEGVIASSINMACSEVLTKESIINIINVLSGTANGLTLTLYKTAVNNAFETSEGLGNGTTSQEWLNLIATKSNWTISLV